MSQIELLEWLVAEHAFEEADLTVPRSVDVQVLPLFLSARQRELAKGVVRSQGMNWNRRAEGFRYTR
jgi:hypothetical protein